MQKETKFVNVGPGYLLVCDHFKTYNLNSDRMIFMKNIHSIEDVPDGIKITFGLGFGYDIVSDITVHTLHNLLKK